MKYFLTAVAFCCCALLAAGDRTFHRGGVTFPMEKISAERFAVKKTPAGKNLVKNGDFSQDFLTSRDNTQGWRRGRWMFGEENRKKFWKEACKIVESRISVVDGKKALDLNRPAELAKLMGKAAGEMYISAEQRVPLPDDQGGVYKLTFTYRSQKIGDGRFLQAILLRYYSEVVKGKEVRPYQVVNYAPVPNWTANPVELTVPAGTKALNISFRSDGCGRTLVRDVSLVKIDTPSMPLTVELAPMKLLDNVFVLASGDPGVIGMRLRNNLPKGHFKHRLFTLNLELPADVEVLGGNTFFTEKITSKPIKVNGKDYKAWQLPFNATIPANVRNSNNFTGWHVPGVMIRSNAKAGLSRECALYITGKGQMLSNKENFTLRMAPALPEVHPGKLFLPGFSSVTADIQFPLFPAAKDAFVNFVTKKSGTRWITASITADEARLFKKLGVKYVTSEPWGIANGYRVGRMPNDKKPAYSIFRDLQGRPVGNHGVYATCPAAIYLKTPYYNEVVVPYVKKAVEGLDGFTPNWEPYTFRNMGCFCDTCKKEFGKYAKLSGEKLDKVWPAELQLGKKYRETAIKFRGWQHGRMVMTLHEEIIAAGGSEVGMCPEVGTDQVLDYPEYNATQGEYSPYNYAGKTKWLNVWGPYVWFIGERPYVYTKAAYLRYWEVIRRAAQDYRKALPGTRAKLLAMPHGNQVSTTALGQPEGMAMDQISAFLAGFDASQLYFFPRGYDHRFWAELGRSSRLIALTEDMVMEGKPFKGAAVTPVTPFPGPVLNISPRMMSDLKKSDVLQVTAFEKGKKILAAVGNFWEKGDVVFKLRIPGLKARQTYSVIEIPYNRQFTREQGKLFNGKELGDGILLHAGALRWVFFVIVPVDAPPAIAQITAAEMAKEKLNLDKRNKVAAETEAARDRALMSENDFGEWKTFSKGGFACKVIDPKGKNLLEITAGKNSALINPRGLVIDSLKIGGVEQVLGNFSLACFWNPGKNGMQSYNPYRVIEQQVTAEGLRIVGECVTSGRTYPALPGVGIRRIITLSRDFKQLTFETILANPTEMSMDEVGFRWYFQPSAWDNNNGGFMEIGGKKITRPHGYSFYRNDIDTASEEKIRNIFLVKNPSVPVKGSVIDFKTPAGKGMVITLQPADQVGGVAVWDTPSLFAATCEPFYKPLTIAPGGNRSFKAVVRIR